ncbi:MAG: immunoglobulin domain-containing protein [Opitutales bacterium]
MNFTNVVTTEKSLERGRHYRISNGGKVGGWVWGFGIRGLLVLGAMMLLGTRAPAQTAGSDRVVFTNSVAPVAPENTASVAGNVTTQAVTQPYVTRSTLTDEEAAAPMNFAVALKMRNFADLEARVGRGEIISQVEMAAKYYPTAEDYGRVADWLLSQGLTITRRSGQHLAVFAQGPVSRVRDAFQVDFARVMGKDGLEYTSAITAPSVPAEVASALISINGLQPHLKMHKHIIMPGSTTPLDPENGYETAPVIQAYNGTALGLTGSGQTIAIVIDVFPKTSDLTAFWKTCGVTRTGSVKFIQTVPGEMEPPSGEETLDTEWSSSMAPGANVRVYGSTDLEPTDIDASYQQIIDDVSNSSIQGLHQASMSFGDTEDDDVLGQMFTDDQFFATLASAGVTLFAASGDGGSRPEFSAFFGTVYSKHGTVQVENPASDPNVTGVGGTTLDLDTNTTGNNVLSETAWSVEGNGESGATGGGASQLFQRPSWQVGTGVPSGNPPAADLGSSPPMRLVPDVAGIADPNTPGLFILDGESQPVGGTSLATPMWAGFCALINQARAKDGQGSLGLLGPKIYPLLLSTAFRDITSGNNGDFSAGVGYDMCTGVGTPNVANLVAALTSEPEIATSPLSVTLNAGQSAMFAVTANSTAGLNYQWQMETSGNTTWSDLSDDGTYSGTSTATLNINAVTLAMSGDEFQCVVTNNFNGSATSSPATLTVNVSYAVTTLAGLSGNAGSTDSSGGSPQFNGPNAVALDLGGNVYVADTNNNVIREITPGGAVTTIAGLAGTSGNTDGTGSAARFNNPTALTVDSGGNIYVADTNNDDIRKIAPGGVVSTLAGMPGVPGTLNGTGAGARFNGPSGIAVDNEGNLFVSDTNNHTIRKVTSAGNVTTIAGLANFNGSVDGIGSGAEFGAPMGIALDNAGNYYVVDASYSTVRQLSFDGFVYTVTTLAGNTGNIGSVDGVGTGAEFNQPAGVATDGQGNVYVSDTQNDTVRKVVVASGVVTTLAGSAGNPGSADGVGTAARFDLPMGLASDGLGNLYIADSKNDTIRKAGPNPAPQWETQPAAKKVIVGQAATFTVLASGTPAPSYQWQASTDGGNTWGNLSEGGSFTGTASTTLTVSPTTAGMSGDEFRAVATNSAGSATSSAAMLTVVTPLTFVTQPASQSVKAGTKVTLAVSATATSALTYQWQKNGVNIAGATNATLVLKSVTATNSGNYTVVATSSLGSLTSDTAALLVVSTAPKITVQPLPVSVIAGSTATFSVTATGMDLSYMWKKGAAIVVDGTNISGADTNTLVLTNVSKTTAGSYLVVVSNPAGKATSHSVKLAVTTP